MDVAGARVLITGANGGIGTAIARRLHGAGATVVLSGRQEQPLVELADALGGRAETVIADLADRDQVAALPERAGHVDILVANAALPASGALLDFETSWIDRALDINLRAPIMLAHALAPAMVERGRGHMVFISSLAGKSGSPGGSMYSATKFGLRGFAQGLHEDLIHTGVGVTTIFPGFIREAGMFHRSGAQLPRGIGTRTAEEVADAVVTGIAKRRMEIDVAPLGIRVAAAFAGIAPGIAAAIQRRMGAHDISASIASGQTDRR